jgi:hypothetical protein
MTESHAPLPPTDITVLLQAVRGGGTAAQEELVQAVYFELKRLAGARLRGQQPGQTFGPTALVHEAWLRLGLDAGQFEDRPIAPSVRTRSRTVSTSRRSRRAPGCRRPIWWRSTRRCTN